MRTFDDMLSKQLQDKEFRKNQLSVQELSNYILYSLSLYGSCPAKDSFVAFGNFPAKDFLFEEPVFGEDDFFLAGADELKAAGFVVAVTPAF